MEDILLGMIHQRSESAGRNVAAVVTKHFLGNIGQASDIVARNIQRGRDPGLPGYNDYREICGLTKACTWKDPPSNIKRTNLELT
jgi:peroxidase